VDFRTAERYKEYREAGLNMLFLQSDDGYGGQPFETSELKKIMDAAFSAGINKVCVFDSGLYVLSATGSQDETARLTFDILLNRQRGFKLPAGKQRTDVITDPDFIKEDYASVYKSAYGGREYAELSAEEKTALEKVVKENYGYLLEYVKGCLFPYINHAAFYGVMLVDEPAWYQLPQTSLMYKAIKQVGKTLGKEIFVQQNLLPLDESSKAAYVSSAELDRLGGDYKACYESYLEEFVKRSGADRIRMDIYPLRQSGSGSNIKYSVLSQYYECLQIMRKVADKYGCSLGAVVQACECTKDADGNVVSWKRPTEADMRWQINSYIGFGFEEIAYYTYWAYKNNGNGAYYTDGSAFMTRDGQKTELYSIMQTIHKEMQSFAGVMMNFDYRGAKYYGSSSEFSTDYLARLDCKENFDGLKSVSAGKGQTALVTELSDEANGQYAYMIMNAAVPEYGVKLTVTLRFASGFDAVEVWSKGEMKLYRLGNDNDILFELEAGDAVYVLPYKM